ncbi:MAG: peroxiredoxin [Pseudomonadota bacterium]
MTLRLGDIAPDFFALTTMGAIQFHDFMDGSWCVLFSHPKDFTPVCTTELGTLARDMKAFAARKVKVIGLSVDSIDKHDAWAADIKATQGVAPNYPLIADPSLHVAKLYGMLPGGGPTDAAERSAADNFTARTVFVIAPDKTIKLMLTYPMTTGRDFGEILRVIDSLQLTAQYNVATPANWRPGQDVIIVPAVSDDEARKAFPCGWRAPRPYMRFVPQPH